MATYLALPDLNLKDVTDEGRCRKLSWKLNPKPKSSFRIEGRIVEDTGQFSARSINNNAVPSYRNKLKECMKADGGHFEHLL